MTNMISTALEPRDFSSDRPDVVFTIDGDVFYGPGNLAVLSAVDLANHVQDLATPTRQTIVDIINLILYPESAELFIARASSPARPISQQQLTDVMTWLLEKHGVRPTEESSDSSTGSHNLVTGSSSTDAGSDAASTSGDSN